MQPSVSVPEEIATKILFLSDRTCCVCRNKEHPIQIHHIDGDHSNNKEENLAVLCMICHNETQLKGGFNRKLDPSLIKLYRDNWLDIVARRRNETPRRNEYEKTMNEYSAEACLEVSLTCHSWKNAYMCLYPGGFMERNGIIYIDIWEKMEKTAKHKYSEAEWERYLLLFDQIIIQTIDKLKDILKMYSDGIPTELKIDIIRTARQMEAERFAYLTLKSSPFHDFDIAFQSRFLEMVRHLGSLSRKADSLKLKE